MFFKSVFDPLRIISQIVLLQCTLYLIMGGFLLLLNLAFNVPIHTAMIFSPKALSAAGWWGYILHFLSALPQPFIFRHVVLRHRLCLDFAATMYGFHILYCLIYSNFAFPKFSFWLTNGLCLVYTIVLSEIMCVRFEMEEIPVSFLSSPAEDNANASKNKKKSISSHIQYQRLKSQEDNIIMTRTHSSNTSMRIPNLVKPDLHNLSSALPIYTPSNKTH